MADRTYQFAEFMPQMLAWDPKDRITAESALSLIGPYRVQPDQDTLLGPIQLANVEANPPRKRQRVI